MTSAWHAVKVANERSGRFTAHFPIVRNSIRHPVNHGGDPLLVLNLLPDLHNAINRNKTAASNPELNFFAKSIYNLSLVPPIETIKRKQREIRVILTELKKITTKIVWCK